MTARFHIGVILAAFVAFASFASAQTERPERPEYRPLQKNQLFLNGEFTAKYVEPSVVSRLTHVEMADAILSFAYGGALSLHVNPIVVNYSYTQGTLQPESEQLPLAYPPIIEGRAIQPNGDNVDFSQLSYKLHYVNVAAKLFEISETIEPSAGVFVYQGVFNYKEDSEPYTSYGVSADLDMRFHLFMFKVGYRQLFDGAVFGELTAQVGVCLWYFYTRE
ncbi:MAG: hypothetical protein GF419_05825 [Ignavibacteriales bacterium]|nr:hypothetical protein [Ignavibacteriales bacterium]